MSIYGKFGDNYRKQNVDIAKKARTDALKTLSKRAILKTDEATGDLIGYKSAEKLQKLFQTNQRIFIKHCN